MKNYFAFLLILFVLQSCSSSRSSSSRTSSSYEVFKPQSKAKTFTHALPVDRTAFVKYAKTLLGVRYKYGSAIPSKGLDCSGFVYHVFGKFGIKAPRRTVDFTYEGQEIPVHKARPGDLILFTGSNHASGIVGHMGIITNNSKELQFIHSASGKNIGVIINSLSGYYAKHFVKIIRVFE